jgi:hypothetical protein
LDVKSRIMARLALRTKKVAISTLVVGVFDWFCRYQTVRDGLAHATTPQIAEFMTRWWVCPVLLISGLALLYFDKLAAMFSGPEYEHTSSYVKVDPAEKPQAAITNSGNITGTGGNATIGDINVYAHPPLHFPIKPSLPEVLPVNVEFEPSEGQFSKMYLRVINHGAEQMFEAQCKVIARRNDPNPQHRATFNLKWENGSAALRLMPGESRNLLIASADEDRSSMIGTIRLESATAIPSPESSWNLGRGEALPEYDVEIIILGQQSNSPKVGDFVVRAGKNRALEMYRRSVNIMSPSDGGGVNYRHDISGLVSPLDAKVDVYVCAGDLLWYHQGQFSANIGWWRIKGWFGKADSPIGGEYKIVAVSNTEISGKQEPRPFPPSIGTQSKTVTVRRTGN